MGQHLGEAGRPISQIAVQSDPQSKRTRRKKGNSELFRVMCHFKRL